MKEYCSRRARGSSRIGRGAVEETVVGCRPDRSRPPSASAALTRSGRRSTSSRACAVEVRIGVGVPARPSASQISQFLTSATPLLTIVARAFVHTDAIHEGGNDAEGPLPLGDDVMSGDLSTCPQDVDLLIVGAGLSGAVLAERCSRELNMTSVVVDKRDHIGGNCYDYVSPDGIRCSKYGAHLFHTQFERVWEYVNKFSEWVPFDHRVKGRVEDDGGVERLVPIPPTQATVNTLFKDTDVEGEDAMQAWYDAERVVPAHGGEPGNGEEAALSRVGARLYEKIFRHYTKKQWDRYPEELDASVLMRLPCRTSTDDRYFPDRYQALPARGYTRLFENMLLGDDNVHVRLNCDFFEHKAAGTLPRHKLLVYTGQIDSYYANLGMPKLEYRSLRFEEEYVANPPGGFFQELMVVNYPGENVRFIFCSRTVCPY